MPRASNYYRRKKRSPNRRRFAKKRNNIRTRTQTFTEVLQAGDIQLNAGGVFKTRMVDIPQYQSYAALYKQFCIKKLQVMIMPRISEFPVDDPGAILPSASVGTSYWVPRIAYSIDDTPDVLVPANELSVLTDNGAKVKQLRNKLTITCWPKPDVGMTDLVNNTTVALRTKKQMWLNFKNADVGSDGEATPHGGIRFYISGNPLFADFAFNVYYKVTFSVRDPA